MMPRADIAQNFRSRSGHLDSRTRDGVIGSGSPISAGKGSTVRHGRMNS
ncbi:MAG: hypothetical protein PHP75_04310 [Methylacidiphilaceae bacterium]|nr:hypothetical protein [Candidatus Methylacidiphilaceae bacterium]